MHAVYSVAYYEKVRVVVMFENKMLIKYEVIKVPEPMDPHGKENMQQP